MPIVVVRYECGEEKTDEKSLLGSLPVLDAGPAWVASSE
jgi:hypothetical protein